MFCVLALSSGLTACRCPGQRDARGAFRSDRAEALAGARAARDVERQFGGVLLDEAFALRVEGVLRRLASSGAEDMPGTHRVRLLDCERANAVSLPGGRIYITLGLYRRLSSDDLLAAVIAHEMAHLAAGDHFADRPVDCHAALAIEMRADEWAAQYLRAAGIPTSALRELLALIHHEQPANWAEGRSARLAAMVE